MGLKFLFFNTDKPKKNETAPFGVLYGTDAPNNANGSNGDYYFRYNNGTEAIYKKSSGVWNIIAGSGGGFSGFTSSNSEEFIATSNFQYIEVSNFTLDDTKNLLVTVDGQLKFKTRDYTIELDGRLKFNTIKEASTDAEVHIFIGTYN